MVHSRSPRRVCWLMPKGIPSILPSLYLHCSHPGPAPFVAHLDYCSHLLPGLLALSCPSQPPVHSPYTARGISLELKSDPVIPCLEPSRAFILLRVKTEVLLRAHKALHDHPTCNPHHHLCCHLLPLSNLLAVALKLQAPTSGPLHLLFPLLRTRSPVSPTAHFLTSFRPRFKYPLFRDAFPVLPDLAGLQDLFLP